MSIKKLLAFAVIPFALLGCPDKADTKPDPSTATGSAKPAASVAPGASAAPAKSGGW